MLAPSPLASAHDQPFWDAARDNRLVLQRCSKTGRFQFYPRAHSLTAQGAALEWVPSPGLGTIHTFTVVHRSFFDNLKAPYVLAMIDLDEGVRVTAHVVDTPVESVGIGQRVRAAFVPRDDALPLLVFRKV